MGTGMQEETSSVSMKGLISSLRPRTQFGCKTPRACFSCHIPWTPTMWVVLWQGCSVHPSFPGGSVILHKEQAPGGIAGTGSLNHNPGTQERLMMLQVLLYTNQKHTKKPYNLIKRKSISSLFFLFFFSLWNIPLRNNSAILHTGVPAQYRDRYCTRKASTF